MINFLPKKRIPELKLTKLEVSETVSRRPLGAGLRSVTTIIDGIPIVEYMREEEPVDQLEKTESVICVDSCDSVPNSPVQEKPRSFERHMVCPEEYSHMSVDFSGNSFSPEPVGFTPNDIGPIHIQSDPMIARKKPTRWDCETPGYRIDTGRHYEASLISEMKIPQRCVTSGVKYELQPRDPRVKTFKKHHTIQPDPEPEPELPPLPSDMCRQPNSVTYAENLMDISSPEYNPPSPFGSPSPTPPLPPLPPPFVSKKRIRGFFDSDSENSEMDLSMGSSYLEMLNRSIGTVIPDSHEDVFKGAEKKGCFWDSSSEEEEVNPTRETLENIKLNSSKDENSRPSSVKPKKRKGSGDRKSRSNYSSDDLETKYNRCEEKRKPSRSKSASSVRESKYKHNKKYSKRSPAGNRKERSPVKYEHRRLHHVCIYCGDRGHFSNDTCPLRVCSMCFKIGHNFRECRLWGKGRSPKCTRCQISCHEKSTCGEIWRQCHNTTSLPTDYPDSCKKSPYHLTKDIQSFRVDQLKQSVYCCNCAKYGHTFFQCNKPRPSRYFFIPLVGHHDIPMSPGFQEMRRNVDSRKCLTQLLPKAYQVVKQQRFWGEGGQSSSSEHSAAEIGSQGEKNKMKKESTDGTKEKGASDTEGSESPDTLQQLEYQKSALNAYHLAFARAHRGESLYAREILNSRGFITVGAFPLLSESKVSVEDRRQLTPLVYLPDRNSYSHLREARERTPPVPPSPAVRIEETVQTRKLTAELQVCESHASFSRRPIKNAGKFYPGKIPKYRREKHFKGKPAAARGRERRERDKKKFDRKRTESRILDARDCINRNRTKRHAERQVRLSERDRSNSPGKPDKEKRTSPPASKREKSPKRTAVKKERTEPREDLSQSSDTFLCIDEAN